MGLDMYLEGRRYAWDKIEGMPEELDGFTVKQVILELGYWRKHPNLHGYIVREFAGGKDECQEIELTIDDLKKIAAAVEANELPETHGFFFGKSGDAREQDTLEQLTAAIEWAALGQGRYVYYRASW